MDKWFCVLINTNDLRPCTITTVFTVHTKYVQWILYVQAISPINLFFHRWTRWFWRTVVKISVKMTQTRLRNASSSHRIRTYILSFLVCAVFVKLFTVFVCDWTNTAIGNFLKYDTLYKARDETTKTSSSGFEFLTVLRWDNAGRIGTV